MSSNLFLQEEWFPKIINDLETEPQEVVKQVERLRTDYRKHLCVCQTHNQWKLMIWLSLCFDVVLKPSTMRISVIGDLRELEDPKKSWLDHFHNISVRLNTTQYPPAQDVFY